MQIRHVWRHKRYTKWCEITKNWISVQILNLQGWNFARLMYFNNYTFNSGYDVTIATYSLLDLSLPKRKLPFLLLQSLTDLLVLVLCNVHIRSHPLNEQQKQITLLEGGKVWFSTWNGESLEPILLPWKCHKGHFMKLCEERNNCTEFQFYTEKVVRDIETPFYTK